MKPPDAQAAPFAPPPLLAEIRMDEFLQQAVSSPTGCPLCRAAEHDEYHLLISLTTALGEGVEARVVEMGPPCNFHGTRFSKVAAGKATARLCRHFLLRQTPADLAEDGGPVCCPICLMLAARQRQWLDVFDALMRNEHARRLYAAGDGLCVPHHRAAQAQPGSARDFLDRCASPQRERLLAGLDRFIRQGHFHTEPGVWGVWKRAREKLFGCPGLTLYLSRRAAGAS